MLSFESRASRRVIGRFERGESIQEAFLAVARQHDVRAAWVSALGAFEWVELVEYDQAKHRYKNALRFDTPCEILSLTGNVSMRDGAPFMHLHACVSRETDNGIQVLGGHLVAGSVFACEFVLDVLDGVELERGLDLATGLHLWRGTSVAAPHAHHTTSSQQSHGASHGHAAAPSGWAQAAAVSARQAPAQPASTGAPRRVLGVEPAPTFTPDPIPPKKRPEFVDEPPEPTPRKGEWVEHQQFGLCQVLGDEGDGGLMIRLHSGVHKSISLDYMRVGEPRDDEQGRRIYKLTPRKK